MTMESPEQTDATGGMLDLRRSIAAEQEAIARALASEARDPARLWTALAPGWTVPLANACGMPGADRTGGAAAVLGRLVAADVVDVFPLDAETPARPEDGYYVMTPDARAETFRALLDVDQPTAAPSNPVAGRLTRSASSPILKAIQSVTAWVRPDSARGATGLLATSADLAGRILGVGSEVFVPTAVRDWARLALHATDPKAAASEFEAAVSGADVVAIGSWIDVARPLALLFEYAGDTDLSLAIARSNRRIELTKRRELDFRHLTSFHRRDEQIEAIRGLLEGPDDRWALHLIGPGGVGKTMVVRYATCLMTQVPNSPCEDDPRPFGQSAAVARVDFDFLNLDFPQINPGLLLVDLAAELRAQGSAATNKLFDRAEDEFRLLNELQKSEGLRRERATLDPRMESGVRAYIEALQSIGKPVVLVLDTCEELAKVEQGGGASTTLEETFRMLRALHDGPEALRDDASVPDGGVPSLRVILSGRRALASAGAGWRIEESSLPMRPYLRIHEIRGFSQSETARYLEHEHAPDNLVRPIVVASSPDLASSISIEYDDRADAPRDVPRCNPYQVRLLLDWAMSNSPPTPEQVAGAGPGRYIELRLIQRLNDTGLQGLLPRVAILGHFDKPTFLAMANLEEKDGDRLFAALADQEWVGMHRSAGTASRLILDIAPSVRDLLAAYFAERGQPSTRELEPAARAIEQLTIESALDEVDWTDFDAGLRVFAADPPRGATWWSMVEHRLFSERPAWVRQVLDRVFSKEGAARAVAPDEAGGAVENPLRAFVLATQARLLAQEGETVALASAWREVADASKLRRDEPPFDRLHRRALAGEVAAARYLGTPPTQELVSDFWAAWVRAESAITNRQEAGSAMAAVETLVDFAELDPRAPSGLFTLPTARPGLERDPDPAPAYPLDTGFRPSRNGWQFTNAFPPGPPVSIGGVVNVGDSAHDFAGGMVLAALDLWSSGVTAAGEGSRPEQGDPGFLYLVKRQVSVSEPILLGGSAAARLRQRAERSFRETWPSIRADLDARRPVPLLLGVATPSRRAPGDATGRHYVLAYAATESPDQLRIAVYDPNRPADDNVELVADLAPDREIEVDHPDFGGLPFVERVPYTPQDPVPWRDDAPRASTADVAARRTTLGPAWLAAEIERTHRSWMLDADAQRGAVDMIRAIARVHAGRAALLTGRLPEARADLMDALTLIPDRPAKASWLDWRPPADVATRVRLEVARSAYPAVLSPSETRALLGKPKLDTSTVDGDRLASAIIDLQLADALPEKPEALLDAWTDRANWQPLLAPNPALGRGEPVNAHRLVPPLFVRASELLAAVSQFAQARRNLQLAAAATQASGDLDARLSADRALLRLSRRTRSTDEDAASPGSVATSTLPSDAALLAALQGLAGRSRPLDAGNASGPTVHARWQASAALDTATALTVTAWGGDALVSALSGELPDPDLDRELLARDVRELLAMESAYHVPLQGQVRMAPEWPTRGWRTWYARHPARPTDALRLFLRDAASGANAASSAGSVLPAELVERLGPRRSADIALEEGELLALRLPSPAVTILRQAGELYATSRDSFGEFACRTLEAMLLTPGPPGPGSVPGPTGPADEFSAGIADALAAFGSYVIDLARTPRTVSVPTVAELEALAASPTDDALNGLQPDELRPWIARLVACLAVRPQAGETSTADDAIRRWLEDRYGTTAEGGAMPPEWARFLEHRRPKQTVVALGSAGGAASEPWVSRTTKILAGGALAGLVGLFIAWRYVAELVWPGIATVAFPLQLVLFVATLGALLAAYWVGRRFFPVVRNLASGWNRVDVVIQEADATTSSAAGGGSRRSSSAGLRVVASLSPTQLGLRPVLARRPLQLRPIRSLPAEEVVVSELDTYEHLGAALPPGVRSLLEERTRLGDPRHVRVMLRGDLQRISWEAVFTRASVNATDPPARAPVRVTRSAIDARVEVSRTLPQPLIGESVCGDDVAGGVIRRALEQGAGGGIEWKLQRDVRAPGQPGAAMPTVVHVVGNVTEDNAGRALQLTPARSHGSQVAPRRSLLPSAAPANPSVGPTPDQLVRADDLAAAYPDTHLFIVQGYPVEETTDRVGSDREAANRTRLYAADLARSGAAVLVIPPLEPAKATEVWGIVNKAAPAFVRRGAVAILPSLTKAQEVILTTRRKKDGWERALDLCVFDGPSAADRRRASSVHRAES